jgi:hypothetical protein
MQLYRIIYYLLSVAVVAEPRQQYMWMKPEAVITVKMLLIMSDKLSVAEYSATTAIHVNETRSCNYS